MRYAGVSEPFQLARCYERDPKTKKTKSMQVWFNNDRWFRDFVDDDLKFCR